MVLRFVRQPSLFLVIVAAEVAHLATAVVRHLAPSGHDGFQYVTLQYFFLNNAIQAHEVAQWIPFMKQGTVATRWFGIQSSFLQNVLLYVAPLLKSADLLSVHHIAMFADVMILLTGTWLLARRFFSPTATFYIAVSIVGSCVWLDQPYWNFRLYYAIPLVLELGHRFIDTGRWRWFFLSANLLAIQTVGNLPYLIPLASFVVFTYFAWYAAINYRIVVDRLRALEWRWPAMLAIAGGVASFVVAYACVSIGTEQLANYNPGRAPDGTTELAGFLRYGGLIDIRQWTEVVLRVSPFLDNTLYAGMLLAPLLLAGIVFVDRRRLHFVLVATTMLLFSLGTPVATAAFYLWPGMKYFRHIGLVSALVKVLFCFVAGIGFEALFEVVRLRNRRMVRAVAAAGAVVLLAGAVIAMRTARSSDDIAQYVSSLPVIEGSRPIHDFQPDELAQRLRLAALLAFCGAALVALGPFALTLRGRSPVFAAGVVSVALAAVTADLYFFKFSYLIDRSDSVAQSERYLWKTAAMPFAGRREVDLHAARMHSDRLAGTLRFNRLLERRFNHLGQVGAEYWTNNAFWFTDEVNHTLQADSWQKPVDELAQMFNKAPGIDFPHGSKALDRISGVAADKIRFFTRAYVISSTDVGPLITDASYNGDVLFLIGTEQLTANGAARWPPGRQASDNDARELAYVVERFDANHLTVRVSNSDGSGAWMVYSDAWHPFWRATVNGKGVPVYRANVAYKAVPIEAGENLIELRFGSRLFAALAALAAANGAFWLIAVVWLARPAAVV